MAVKSIDESVSPEVIGDPRWAAVRKVADSPHFLRATLLRDFLFYIAENELSRHPEEITEQKIGHRVYKRNEVYSPADDNIVRVSANQLRAKLREFYETEGKDEPWIIEIPKGKYVPVFNERTAPKIEAPLDTPQKVSARTDRWLFAVAVFTAAAAVACAFGWYRAVRANAATPVPWPLNAVIQPDRQTRVVVSDSSTMLRQLGNHEVTLDEYLQPDFRKSLIPPHLPENFSRLLNYVSDSQLTSFADLTVYSSLAKLGGRLDSQLVLTPARDLDRRDLERGNYVFVGSPTSNPWVLLFADQLNFQVVEDGIGGKMYFLNKKPLPGEQNVYQGLSETGSGGQDYATISLLPGSMGQGNVLILQGLRQEGTEALGELLANPDDRAQLERALAMRGDSQHSPYFEALIRAQAIAGAPVSIQIVTVRTIHR